MNGEFPVEPFDIPLFGTEFPVTSIHSKQLIFKLERVVLHSTLAHHYEPSTILLSISLVAQNTTDGFPPSLTLASSSFPLLFVIEDGPSPEQQEDHTSLLLDPSHPLASKPISLPFDPVVCRRAGAVSLSLRLSLQFGTALLETRHVLCSVSSPTDLRTPRSSSPFLAFDEPD